MGTLWRTPGAWRKGEGVPDRKFGPESQGGVTDGAQLGPKRGLSKGHILVFEN